MNNKPIEGSLAILLSAAAFTVLNMLNGLSDGSVAMGFMAGAVLASAIIFTLGASRKWDVFPALPLFGIVLSGISLSIGATPLVYLGMLIFSAATIMHDRIIEPKFNQSR